MKNNNLKTILVTGGARRIGKEICKYFAENNFNVVIHCNKSINEGEKLCLELNTRTTGYHKIINGNLLDLEFQKQIFEKNKIDVLINNASIFENKSLINEEITTAKYQFEVNFWIPYNLMQLFKKYYTEGLIINIIDSSIEKNNFNSGSYILSKKTLADLTRLAALQWAPKIRVNGISPGFVIPPEWINNSKMEKSIEKTPMKKSVKLQEIAEACMFLYKNSSITGEIINIDGGIHL